MCSTEQDAHTVPKTPALIRRMFQKCAIWIFASLTWVTAISTEISQTALVACMQKNELPLGDVIIAVRDLTRLSRWPALSLTLSVVCEGMRPVWRSRTWIRAAHLLCTQPTVDMLLRSQPSLRCSPHITLTPSFHTLPYPRVLAIACVNCSFLSCCTVELTTLALSCWASYPFMWSTGG